jgi:hypothetical protein
MDIQDLLYTNKFINTQVLGESQTKKGTSQYPRVISYIDNNFNSDINRLDNYTDNDLYEDNPVNVDKTLDKPFPVGLNKNHYPMFDKQLNDLNSKSYRKIKKTDVSVNSIDRDPKAFLYAANYQIYLTRKFTNINKFILKDIAISNFIPPINNTNNNISWQYPNIEILVNNFGISHLIPVPKINDLANIVQIQALFNQNLSDTDDINLLTYQTTIPEGFYDTDSFCNNFKQSVSRVVHGATWANSQYLLNLANTTNGYNTEAQPWKYKYEEPYYGSFQNDKNAKHINTPTLMNIDINPQTHAVKIVNRMEELEIVAIQTFDSFIGRSSSGPSTSYMSSSVQDSDIFYPYTKTKPYNIDPTNFYITVALQDSITNYFFSYTASSSPPSTKVNVFPIVITGLKHNIGGISAEAINYTEFFYQGAYTTTGYTNSQIYSVSTYNFDNYIIIPTSVVKYDYSTTPATTVNITVNKYYLRIAFKLSTGNFMGLKYNAYGYVIKPLMAQTIIYNESIIDLMKNNNIPPTTTNYQTPFRTAYRYESKQDTSPLLGRALYFRFIFDIANNNYVDYEVQSNYEKKRSVLNMLAWEITNDSSNDVTASYQTVFRAVWTNYQSVMVNFNQGISTFLNLNIPDNIFPNKKMNLQCVNGLYYFRLYDFVFIKILPLTNKSIIDNNMLRTLDNNAITNYDVYIDNYLLNIGIGETPNCNADNNYLLKSVDTTSIMCKILLSDVTGSINKSTANIEKNELYFYDRSLDNIDTLEIQILDPLGKLISLTCEHSFTLEIHEIVDVLKETLVDTTRDQVFTTGYNDNV